MKTPHLYIHLGVALAASLTTASTAQAAGLEYTKQSILPFFESGHHAEVSYATVSIDIQGTDAAGNKINNVMDDFDLYGAAVKIAPTDNTAIALLYDQPFGVDTVYPTGSVFNNSMGKTEARVNTEGLTLLGGGKLDNNVWLYGGMELQKADGKVTLAQQFDGIPVYYQLDVPNTSDTLIPVLGVAYEIPDILLRASLTWRGQGEHKFQANERLLVNLGTPTDYNDIPAAAKSAFDLPDVKFGNTQLSMKTPQSVNLDFQTGLSEKHQLLGMVNARWVEWTAFEVAPAAITQVVGEPLASYKNDAYAVEVALGKQFTPKFAAEVRAGFDSGTGEPLSLLGPYDSIKTLAVGGEYAVTDSIKVSAGGQYMWFEGGEAYSDVDGSKLASFDDGDGYAFGVKLGYNF